MSVKLSHGHFYGEVIKSHEVAGFLLTETTYYPGAKLPKHSHEHAYFCLVRQGTYTEAYGPHSRDCGPLTFAFHPPDEVHSEAFGRSEVRSFNIELERQWLARMREHSIKLDSPIELPGGLATQLALRLYREFRLMDMASPLAIEGLILEIVAEAARRSLNHAKPNYPRWLEQVRELLHDRFTESLTLAELAAIVGVHPVHLATVFRQKFRCTVGEYLRQLRLEQACRLLTSSQKSLAEIAVLAGFADQSHFSRTLKQSLGVTPAQYRASLRLN